MVSDSAVYRSLEDRSVSDNSGSGESETFPAGSSIVLLGLWFVFARALAHMTARRPAMLEVATFTGVAGALLALAAIFAALGWATLETRGSLRILHALRMVVVAPLALFMSISLFREPAATFQWSAVLSVGATVLLSCAWAMARGRTTIAARVTFATLLVGSLIELAYAPAQAMLEPGGVGAVRMAWLGRLSEACTFAGSIAAARWSFTASKALVGAARTRLFLPFSVAVASVMAGLVVVLPANVATFVGRTTFGVRFDWAMGDQSAVLSKPVLFAYLVAPVGLLSAAALSMASVGQDRGAGSRRVLAVLLLLFSGFGVLRLAGPMDPIRLVMVALAVVLFERAQSREQPREVTESSTASTVRVASPSSVVSDAPASEASESAQSDTATAVAESDASNQGR
jgi:hypothetical protein